MSQGTVDTLQSLATLAVAGALLFHVLWTRR